MGVGCARPPAHLDQEDSQPLPCPKTWPHPRLAGGSPLLTAPITQQQGPAGYRNLSEELASMLILLLDIQPQFWPNALHHSPATSRPPLLLYPSSPPAYPQILSPERLRQSQLKRLTVEIVSLSAGLSRRSAGRELSFRSEKGTQLGSLIARQYSGRRFSLASKSRVTSQILTHL